MPGARLTTLSIDDLARAAASSDPDDRSRAMQALLIRVRRDPSLAPAALPIFRRVTGFVRDGWSTALAAQGIEDIEGDVAARPVWTRLLGHDTPGVVRSALGSISDPWYAPAALALLEQRSEAEVRTSAIRTLGRMRHEPAFSVIVPLLDDLALRADVIEALADMGDVRAKPFLERLVEDQTETGEYDERGATVRIGHLAWNAIRRLDDPRFARMYQSPLPLNYDIWGDPVPPMLGGPPPFRVDPAPPAAPAPRPASSPAPASVAAPAPQVLSGTPSAATQAPARAATLERFVALVPLALAVVEVMWAFALLAAYADSARIARPTREQTHNMDALGMVPGLVGILAAIVIPFRYRVSRLGYVALLVGAIACLPLVILFGMELLTP